jgi:hypothetical protein
MLALGGCALQPTLSDVTVAPNVISPNADGAEDVTHINYRVNRSADVSIYFVDAQGRRHYFRKAQRRSPGKYDVYWGGVINDPQVRLVNEQPLLVESQVLGDGVYTWVIEAVDDGGRSQTAQGQITLRDADTTLPELHNFTVIPQVFRPNQDGLRDDRVAVSYYLTKKAERAARRHPAEIPGGREVVGLDRGTGRGGLSRLRLRWRCGSQRRAAARRRVYCLR